MVTIKQWNRIFKSWEEILKEKFPGKVVKGAVEWDRFCIKVRDVVSFSFNIGHRTFTEVYIENCEEEDAKTYAEELFNCLEQQNVSMFVSIQHKVNEWYYSWKLEKDHMFEEWVAIGEKAKHIVNILENVSYKKDGKVFYLFEEEETLFPESFQIQFDIENGKVRLMVGDEENNLICYDIFSETDSLRNFITYSKNEMEEVERIINETTTEETDCLEFEISRKREGGNYNLLLEIEGVVNGITLEEVKEDIIIEYVRKAYEIRKTKKETEKTIKQMLFKKDKYGFEYESKIWLFDEKYVIDFRIESYMNPDEYTCVMRFNQTNSSGSFGQNMKTERGEWTGSIEEIINMCKELFKKWLSAKAMEELVSSTEKSHTMKMKWQLGGRIHDFFYTNAKDWSAKQKQKSEKILEKYYEKSAKINGIPLVQYNSRIKAIVLGDIRFEGRGQGFNMYMETKEIEL